MRGKMRSVTFQEFLKNLNIEISPKEVLSKLPSNSDVYWVCRLKLETDMTFIEIMNLYLSDVKLLKIKPQIYKELKEYLINKKGLLNNERLFYDFCKDSRTAYRTFRKQLKRKLNPI